MTSTPPPGPATPPAPAARRPSLAGPVWLTVAGAVLLVGAIVAGVATTVLLVGTASSGVLRLDGQAGDVVVAEIDAPGAGTVELEAGERYAVHLVVPSDTDDATLDEDVLLQTPSGEIVAADGSPGVDMSSTVGQWSAGTVGAFTAPATGTYTVAVPPASVADARVLIAPDRDFAPFLRNIFGSVLGMLLAIGLGVVGVPVLVGGIVWWALRARSRRTA